MQQLTKSCTFLKQSGGFLHRDKEVAVTGYCWMYLHHKMFSTCQRKKEVYVEHLPNLLKGPNNEEFVRDRVSQSL